MNTKRNALTYDGHGLNNANGDRVITWQRKNADNGGGYVLERDEREVLGPILAAAPELLKALRDAYEILLSRGEKLGLDDGGPVMDDIRNTIAKATST